MGVTTTGWRAMLDPLNYWWPKHGICDIRECAVIIALENGLSGEMGGMICRSNQSRYRRCQVFSHYSGSYAAHQVLIGFIWKYGEIFFVLSKTSFLISLKNRSLSLRRLLVNYLQSRISGRSSYSWYGKYCPPWRSIQYPSSWQILFYYLPWFDWTSSKPRFRTFFIIYYHTQFIDAHVIITGSLVITSSLMLLSRVSLPYTGLSSSSRTVRVP